MTAIRFCISLILGILLGILIFFAMMAMTGGVNFEFCRDFAITSGAILTAFFNFYLG